jgi:hypothetical protein
LAPDLSEIAFREIGPMAAAMVSLPPSGVVISLSTGRSTIAVRRFGSIARPVPSTTITPPNQIHFTSGFKYA